MTIQYDEANVVSFFSQHLVPIVFTFRSRDRGLNVSVAITTCVMSVREQWFLVTAGHCIRQINDKLNSFELSSCELVDSFGVDAINHHTIPFEYNTEIIFFSESYPIDYAAIPLSPYYVRLLDFNKIVALNEETWRKQPKSVYSYVLLGIPEQLSHFEHGIDLSPILIPVKEVKEKPPAFDDDEGNVLFGSIMVDDLSIKGMSGGPILSIYQNEIGEMRYFLTAIQSRWNSATGEIAACFARSLGEFIDSIYQELSQQE